MPPPNLTAAQINARMAQMRRAKAGMQQAVPVTSPAPAADDPPNRASSNQRFRSFAERYVVERANTFGKDSEIEDAHKSILSARTVYNMIREMGRTLKDDG